MPKKKMWVSWEDGAELSHSRKSPGDLSPLTRDGDKNLGHVVLQPIDDTEEAEDVSEPEPVYIYVESTESDAQQATTEEMWASLLLLGAVLALQHGPEIKRWWSATGQPVWELARERLAKSRLRRRRKVKPAHVPTEVAQVVTDEDVSTALENFRDSIDSDEARERLIAALVARQFADKQIEILKNARIEDREEPGTHLAPLDAVTPEELEAALRLLLKANPTLLDSEQFAQVGASLRGEVVVSRPARRRRVVEVARRRVVRRANA